MRAPYARPGTGSSRGSFRFRGARRSLLPVLAATAALASLASGAAARTLFTGVAGNQAAAVISADGGLWFASESHRDWQPAAGADPLRDYTAALAVSDNFFVVVAADGSVWRSTNPAATGFVLRTSVSGGLRALVQVGAQLLAVGDGGQIVRSSDLAAGSWVPVTSPTPRTLRGVATNGISSTVAVGDAGTILRGGTNGSSFQVVPIDEDRTFYAVTTDANGRYLAVGEGGAAWVGDAGGFTWTRIEIGTTETLRGATRVGAANVVVGEDQVAFYSSANFSAWQRANTPTLPDVGGYGLHAVTYTGADLVAVGDRRVALWSFIGLQWSRGDVTAVVEESWGRVKRRFLGSR